MTDQQHPITPPPELVQQWEEDWHHSKVNIELELYIATLAAQWGADQEMEACCDCILSAHSDPAVTGDAALIDKRVLVRQLRTARRPKPPSLKEQALSEVAAAVSGGNITPEQGATIRLALEALMTYDELYEHIVHYVAQPLDDKRKACLILGAFMEFILDCQDEGVDVNKIDITDYVNEKLEESK